MMYILVLYQCMYIFCVKIYVYKHVFQNNNICARINILFCHWYVHKYQNDISL